MRGLPLRFSLAHNRERARERGRRANVWDAGVYIHRGVKASKAVTIIANVCAHRRLSASPAVGCFPMVHFFFFFFPDLSKKRKLRVRW